jgi:hypothetical protein
MSVSTANHGPFLMNRRRRLRLEQERGAGVDFVGEV